MDRKQSFYDILTWLVGLLALLVLLYFLTAPPIIIAAVKQSGGVSIPFVYQPFMNIIESDYFGGPLLWYCNRVWHMGIILIGEELGPPWYLIALYIVIGLALLGAVCFPFIRRMRRTANKALPRTSASVST